MNERKDLEVDIARAKSLSRSPLIMYAAPPESAR
jgi:hypothetical protein